jgi:Zn-dependent metalloprotease
MSDYVNTTSDNGEVHINSGIPNKTFYEVAMRMGGNAWERAGMAWYVTLRDRLRPDSDFQAAANPTFAVAGERYSAGGLEQTAVHDGWDSLGIAAR